MEKDTLNSKNMERAELEKGHLQVFMGVAFCERAKFVEGGKRIVKLDWDEFQQVVMRFYELGKEEGVSVTKEKKDGTD